MYNKCNFCVNCDVCSDKCLRLDNDKYRAEAYESEDFSEALSSLRKKTSEMPLGEF